MEGISKISREILEKYYKMPDQVLVKSDLNPYFLHLGPNLSLARIAENRMYVVQIFRYTF